MGRGFSITHSQLVRVRVGKRAFEGRFRQDDVISFPRGPHFFSVSFCLVAAFEFEKWGLALPQSDWTLCGGEIW